MSDLSHSSGRSENQVNAELAEAGQEPVTESPPSYEESIQPETNTAPFQRAYSDPYAPIEFPPAPPPYESVFPPSTAAYPAPSVQFPTYTAAGYEPSTESPHHQIVQNDHQNEYRHSQHEYSARSTSYPAVPFSPIEAYPLQHATYPPQAHRTGQGKTSHTQHNPGESISSSEPTPPASPDQASDDRQGPLHRPQHADDEAELPPLPTVVQVFIRVGVFISIGLIVIAGLGFTYNMFAYKVGAGIWVGIMALFVFSACHDPRPHYKMRRRRFVYIVMNALAFLMATFLLVWFAIGIATENKYFSACNFEGSIVINCTHFELETAVSGVETPNSYGNIRARVILQAFGMIGAFCVIVCLSCIFHHTKSLPVQVGDIRVL